MKFALAALLLSLGTASGVALACEDGHCSMSMAAGTNAPVVTADATPPATQPSKAENVGNTKCIVEVEDISKKAGTVEYKGKAYNVCCKDCIAEFNKDPEKFVKKFEADPAKYGVKKQ